MRIQASTNKFENDTSSLRHRVHKLTLTAEDNIEERMLCSLFHLASEFDEMKKRADPQCTTTTTTNTPATGVSV